jgi:NTP pyrophosphatase (non-canonical NTP hydrolase)
MKNYIKQKLRALVIESYSLKKKLYGDEYIDEIKEKLAKELSTLKFIMHKLERDRKLDKSKKQKKLEKLTKEKNELEKELEKLYDA